MFRAFVSGAGLAALIDAVLALRVAAVKGLRLEYFQWAMFGTLSVAILVAIGLKLVLGRKRYSGWQLRLADGQAFWAGVMMGLMPMISVYLPFLEVRKLPLFQLNRYVCLVIWMIPVLLVLRIAPKAPRFVRPQYRRSNVVFLLPILVAVLSYGYGLSVGPKLKPRPELPAAAGLQTELAGRPDIVLVSLDTLRKDIQRGSIELLPLLGELKKTGWWSERCLSTSNQTVPGHIGMLAGLEQDQHIVNQNSELLATPDSLLFATQLKEHGYRTAGVISNAMVNGFSAGFEAFDNSRADYGERYHFMRLASGSTWFSKVYGVRRATSMVEKWLGLTGAETLPPGMSAYTTESALQYLNQLVKAPNRPFHLFVHYMDAHSPYSPPASTMERFSKASDLPEPYRKVRFDNRLLINRIRADLDSEQTRGQAKQAASHLRDLYDEEVLYLGEQLKRLVDGVQASGRPTLLIITSDHGEFFGEHNLMEHSRELYNEIVDVPFVMVGVNGFQVPTGESPNIVSLTDVVPTMAAAAGVGLNRGTNQSCRGLNLLDPANAEEMAHRIHLMAWNSNAHGLIAAAQRGQWKVIGRIVPNQDLNELPSLERMEVYNLDLDPKEANNVIADSGSEVDDLWQRLEDAGGSWHSQDAFDSSKRQDLAAQDRDLMHHLGYADEPPPPSNSDVESHAATSGKLTD
ncbi:MAG: sulfatase-like hydrolase/transferase [Planctomycetes bacterium]|nr:sulfatase-like hydrolase/transferase [Planctomycetota bacterium]